MTRSAKPARPGPERVPLFGTWRAAYLWVIACTLLVMGALRLFQGWSF